MIDLRQLRQSVAQGMSFEYVFFWGHRPSYDGKMNTTCLSQWYNAPFVVDGVEYSTAEHWMMAEKARLFNDEPIVAEILATPDPKTAKLLGRKVRKFDEAVWKKNARRIVTEGSVAKFGQHAHLLKFLLNTGDAVLVEASPYDRIWGIGLKEADSRAKHPGNWLGENWLGFSLMEARSILRGRLTDA